MKIKNLIITIILACTFLLVDTQETLSENVTCEVTFSSSFLGWRYREWTCTTPNPFGPGTITWRWYTLEWNGYPIWEHSEPIEKKRIELEEEFIEFNVKLYPNPTSHILNINSDYFVGKDIVVFLLDINSKEIAQIYNSFSEGSNIELNLGNINSGLYYLKIQSDENIIYKKLLITN